VSPPEQTPAVPATVPQAVDRSGAVVDLGAQADRLKAKLAEVTAYREPSRNVFRFGSPPRLAEPPAPVMNEATVVIPPSRLRYGLAGMATTVEDGIPQRTAILSSQDGVALVKEGETLDTRYRVVSIGEDMVILESTSDGTQTTLRLAN
jgi:hypothetical protein